MLKLGFILTLVLCGFLAFQNQSLREKAHDLEGKLEARVESIKVEPAPVATQAPPPCKADPKVGYLEKLLDYRKRLLEKQTKLAELKKKLEALKTKSPKIADPVEFDRRIHEKKEQLAELRERVRVARQNPSPQHASPEYEGIKGKLQEIEKQIHEAKASMKAIDQASDANASSKKTELKSKLAELHDQLKETQVKQKAFIAQSAETTGDLPESTLKRKSSALSKEIRKMESMKETQTPAKTTSSTEEEPLAKEISMVSEEILSLEKIIKELESLSSTR